MGGTPLNGKSSCPKTLSRKGGYSLPPPLNGQNPLSSFLKLPLALVVMIMIKMHVVLVVASLAVGAKNAVATIVDISSCWRYVEKVNKIEC